LQAGRPAGAGGAVGPPAGPAGRGPKKKPEPPSGTPSGHEGSTSEAGPGRGLTPENAAEVWTEALGRVSGLAVEHARQFDRIAISAPNRLVIHLKPGYTLAKSVCERPDQLAKFEKALAEVTGRPVRVEFALSEEESGPDRAERPSPQVSPQQRLMEVAQRPIMRRASDLFGVQPIRVDPPEQE